MKKSLGFALVMLLLAVHVAGVGAQGTPAPTIFNFASDLVTISVPDAETGTTQATLTWHVAHVNDSHKIMLYTYQLKGWVLLAGEEQILPPVAGIIVNVVHPGTFAPPTYRLAVIDSAGAVLDERLIVIPYAPAAAAPTIAAFTTTAQTIDSAALADGSARVDVAWEIANRTPLTNLVFDQVLDDGTIHNVELPRDTLWIASTGAGMVAPVDPGEGQPVTLRLRVVDVITAEVYDDVLIALGGPVPESAEAAPAEAESNAEVPAAQPTQAAFPTPVQTLVPPSPTPLVN